MSKPECPICQALDAMKVTGDRRHYMHQLTNAQIEIDEIALHAQDAGHEITSEDIDAVIDLAQAISEREDQGKLN